MAIMLLHFPLWLIIQLSYWLVSIPHLSLSFHPTSVPRRENNVPFPPHPFAVHASSTKGVYPTGLAVTGVMPSTDDSVAPSPSAGSRGVGGQALGGVESLLENRPEVGRLLEADAHPQQIGVDAERGGPVELGVVG